jgi:3-phenylpropionate/trans-cinnamate dioxygenase ferredoxin component
LADGSRDDVSWEPLPVALPEPGGTRAFKLRWRRLLLCNAGGTPYVIENACPHVRVSLEGGAIEGTVLECPHHGGRLDLRDGRPVRLPIRQAVGTYAVRVAGDGALEVAIPGRAASFPPGATTRA